MKAMKKASQTLTSVMGREFWSYIEQPELPSLLTVLFERQPRLSGMTGKWLLCAAGDHVCAIIMERLFTSLFTGSRRDARLPATRNP